MTTNIHTKMHNPAPDDHGPHASAAIVPGRIDSSFVRVSSGSASDERPGLFTAANVLHSLRRRWILTILLGLFLGVAAAGTTWFVQKPQYQAAAVLRIASQPTTLVFETKDQPRSSDYERYRSTQRETILSQFVIANALNRDAVRKLPIVLEQANPTEWLRSKLRVTFLGDSELMQVSMSDPDKKIIPLLINAVVDTYMVEVVDRERTDRQVPLAELRKLQTDREIELKNLREELESMTAALGGAVSTTAAAKGGETSRVASLESEINRVELALLKAQAERALVPADPGPTAPVVAERPADGAQVHIAAKIPAQQLVSELDLDTAALADPECQLLKGQIDKKRKLVDQTKQLFRPLDARKRIEQYQLEIAQAEQELKVRREKLREELAVLQLDQQQKSGRMLDYQIAILKKQKETLTAQLRQIELATGRSGGGSNDIEMKRAKIQSTEQILAQLKQEYERRDVELKATPRVTLRNSAAEPAAPNPWAALPLSLAAGLAGFFLPVFLIVFGDARQQIVSSPMQVIDEIGLPVLGQVPHIPRSRREKDEVGSRHDEFQDHLREAVNGVAAMLIRWGENRSSRVIMVSSAVAGEGKTTLAGHLAIGLAEGGHRVLLLDFDLRRPALHDSFGQELEPGVGNLCIESETPLAATLKRTAIPNLTLMPAGHCPANSLTTLSKERLQKLFDRLKPDFDYLIVDSSPILQSVDARLIGRHVDGVVLSLLRDVSRMPKVTNACEMLRTYQIPLLGSVLLGCSSDVYYSRRRTSTAGSASASA